MKKLLPLLCLFLLLSNNSIKGQHYDNWEGFEYDTIKPESGNLDAGVYELQKDYTISLPEYINDQSRMPSKKGQIMNTYRGDAEFYRNWAASLPPVEWDFIRIEYGGILTIKKGYRWDGSSNPIEKMKYFSYRSSLVHDALYDLMRMGYLKPDKHHNVPVWIPPFGWVSLDTHVLWDSGDYNRAMADIIHFMIAWEDGDSKDGAFKDFKVLRKGGAFNSHNDELLCSWKFHVSDLAAYATDGKVELKWKRANEAGKNPNNESTTEYDIMRNGQKIATVDRWMSTYSDTEVTNNGSTYTYQIKSSLENTDLYDWSNFKYSVPVKGAGNALKLDGINNYMEANTTSNDLCYGFSLLPLLNSFAMEAWVKPENQTGKSAILAFNTISGAKLNILMYDGDSKQFCYYDEGVKYIYSTDSYPVDNWYHVAVTVDMFGRGKLYVNGTDQAEFITPVKPRHGARFSIGQEWDNNITSNFFKGCIDEVRIWNYARTQDDLKRNMNNPLRGDEGGLVALWHFNEPENATWFYTDDATVNDNIGKLLGYATTETPFVPSGAMDGLPLLFGVPDDITVECDAVPSPADVTAEDADGVEIEVIFSETKNNGPCANSYILIRSWTTTDADGNTTSASQTVTVNDTTVPIITGVPVESLSQGNDEASCGALAEYPEIAAIDNCSETVNLSFDPEPGTFLPVGIHTVSVSATDDCGNTNTATFDVNITNEIPVIEQISASSEYSSRNGDVLYATAVYNDNNLTEAVWDWGDGTTSNGTIDGNTITGEHHYQAIDDYVLTLTVTDLCGETSSKQYILTNNSDRAYVTGDGWINLQERAFVKRNRTRNEAKFSFVCKYNMYGETLRGKTLFHFKQGELEFKSLSYNKLTITDDKAVFHGTGTINRKTGFGFMISVIDGDLNDNDEKDRFRKKIWDKKDRFRIKIWDKKDETVIYDNEIGADEELDPTTGLGGGSIVIHIRETENESIPDNNINNLTNEDINAKMLIYPNPVKDILTVRIFRNEDKKAYLKIYNSFGKLMHSYSVKGNINKEIDVSAYKTGLYFVTIIINGEIIKQKVLIE